MLLIFLSIFVVSDIYLEELYLFEWTKRNRYWGMWLLTIALFLLTGIVVNCIWRKAKHEKIKLKLVDTDFFC